MSDENELDKPVRFRSRLVPRPVLSTCGAGRRRCRHRPLPVAPWLLMRSSSRLALLALCLSCGLFSDASVVSACYPLRSIVVSFGSPSFDKWGGAVAVCVSVWGRLVRCCLSLAVADRERGVLGRSPREGCSPPAVFPVSGGGVFPSCPLLAVGLFLLGRRCSLVSSHRSCLLALVVVRCLRLVVFSLSPAVLSCASSPLLASLRRRGVVMG